MSFFKKFFNDIIKDHKAEDDTVTVKGKPKPKFYGTVAPYPNQNVGSDAAALEHAIEERGVNENVIIDVLVNRNNQQRQQIKAVFESTTGKSLENALEGALRGDMEKVALALLMTPAQFDAHCIREACKCWGTRENVLVEILATRTTEQIQEITAIYKKEYGRDLEEELIDETRGDFQKALLAMYRNHRDTDTEVDMELVKKDAEALFEAGENSVKTNVETFIDILTTRSHAQLSKTFQRYARFSDLSLPRALQMELDGDVEDCLVNIVKVCWNTPAFFAEILHAAMDGHGTCEDTLIRVLVSRSEVDLKKIVDEYHIMFERYLQDDIVGDTKRDREKHFRNVLLALCGPA